MRSNTSSSQSGVQSLAVVLGALDPVHGPVGGRLGADGTQAVAVHGGVRVPVVSAHNHVVSPLWIQGPPGGKFAY